MAILAPQLHMPSLKWIAGAAVIEIGRRANRLPAIRSMAVLAGDFDCAMRVQSSIRSLREQADGTDAKRNAA